MGFIGATSAPVASRTEAEPSVGFRCARCEERRSLRAADSFGRRSGVWRRTRRRGLFDFSRVRASKARLETARLSGAKVQDEITRQVVESHARAQSLLDQITTTKQNLATASETLRLTRARKQFGVGAVLEDIQAQQELTRARSDYLSAVAEFNKAQYGLAKAVGELSETGKTDNNTRTSMPRE
ncbi:MAG: hypothetical protein DME21_08580 [Verrucomicrobia bacterium]|nr:MAG: hypothetical protein DME21_08580 [Verrucomicrobiota bacterium]